VTRARSIVLAAALLASACASSSRDTAPDRRAYAQLTREATLVELEKAKPGTRARIERAVGWAAFGSGGAEAFGAKPGEGFGVAHDNARNVDTYMTMTAVDADPFRVVIVFDDEARFRAFVRSGGAFESDLPAGVEAYCILPGGLAPASELAGTTFKPSPDMK